VFAALDGWLLEVADFFFHGRYVVSARDCCGGDFLALTAHFNFFGFAFGFLLQTPLLTIGHD
jgi:hypothetical protein